MHIGLDLQPLQLDSYRNRGIGTHLRSWLTAAQSLSSDFTVSLCYNPYLPLPDFHPSAPNWSLQPLDLPPELAKATPDKIHKDPDEAFIFDSAVEGFLRHHQFDLFHASHLLMWEAFAPRRLFYTRWVATFYDLIPLHFHDEYLAPLGEQALQAFAQRLGATVYAQRVQTISRSAQEAITKATGLPADQIDVIYGGVDEAFQPLNSRAEVEKSLSKFGITGDYIFSVSGVHHTKNLTGLLNTYSLLPQAIRQKYGLVVLLPLSGQLRRNIEADCQQLGIAGQVKLVNQVSQAELVALYNGATLTVHPTFFEGLGLPLLESMRCGTPVIASNLSSMPEIGGEAALLVDPYQPQTVTTAIEKVLGSPDLQADMREQGFAQASKFTWQRTAEAVLASYQQAVQAPTNALKRPFQANKASAKKRLRLAYWSPVNPRPSGISDYSEALIAELRHLADIDLFVDGYQPTNLPLFDLVPSFNGRDYQRLNQHQPYDLNLYHLGNNPLHSYLYRQSLGNPGLVTLHDFCLFHMLHKYFVGSGNFNGLWDEIAYCENVQDLTTIKRDYFTQTLDEYTLPVNRRLIEASRGVVVHSHFSQSRLQQYEAVPPIEVVPMGTMLLPDDGGRFGRRIRRMLGLPEDGFIFGMFGNVHPAKRVPAILNAFARLRQKEPKAALFIMGAVSVSALEMMRPFRQNMAAAREQGIYLHLMYARFDLMLMAMQAIDVGLNLRYPTAGETSSTLSFLLGQGKPTLVSNVGSFAEYPDACCPKIPVDDNEEETLFQQMSRLIESEQSYQQAQQAAFAYSQDKTWPLIAERYMTFIEGLLTD